MCRWPFCILFFALSLTTGSRLTAQSTKQLALLIGIDDYIAERDLRGCVNDVERFKSVLIGKFGFTETNVATLRNAQATRAGIIAAFEDLIQRTQGGDVVLVHYSGHGSRVQDVSSDEDDGWDETIVPHDSRQAGIFDLSDDEINALMARLTSKTPNVTIVLDSCHSGSATRGGADVRRIRDDPRRPPPPQSPTATRVAEGVDDFRQRDAAYVLITGSRPHELSNEFDVDGVRHGALTHFLSNALLAAPPGATYRAVMERVSVQVTNEFPSQHPQLEGAADRVVFGIQKTIAAPYLLAHPEGTAAILEAGAVHGLTVGSELDVYAPGTLDFANAKPLARVRVKGGMTGLRSEADIVTGGPIAKAARAVIRTRTYPDSKLRVHLSQPETTTLSQVRARLAEFTGFEIVTDETRADLRLRHERNLIFTESADLVQLSPPLGADAPDVVDLVVKRATTWMKWFAILRLENPEARLPAAIKVGDGNKTRFTSGDTVQITVTNLSSEKAFLTLLNLDADGAVTSLSVEADRTDPIPPFGTRVRTIKLTTPPDRAFVPDVLKAILTTAPLAPEHFAQAAARGTDPAPPTANPLNRLIRSTVVGQSRAATVVESASWGTAAARVETWQLTPARPPQPSGFVEMPRVEGYVLHFPDGTRETIPGIASRGLPQCSAAGEQLDQCFEITPMGPSSASFEVRPAGRAANSRAPRSLGAAWDEAERLRTQTGAEFVEPVFEAAVDVEAIDPSARTSRDTPDKAAAKADTEWSLKHIAAFEARARLRNDLKRRQEAEAEGIIVAHPDTGYRQHPEFWSQDIAKSPVLFESGWNFVENNERPLDLLQDSGSLANPGHGTKSGSVIVSPPGKQWSGGSINEFVTGVAPGARLVPFRVHTSVVHFNPSRLAQAINHAAAPDGVKVRLPQGANVSVISISMGGLPSMALYKAVRTAEQNGVLLIAAAGNQVRTVVWPARFDSAVAIAATNVDCGTWPGSSHGGAVDIAAPGESVWHAGVGTDGALSVGMGQGTTYATATTAGVAALWVARHGGTPLFDKLKREGRLTEAFRAAVQRTSWRPGGTGDLAPPSGVKCTHTTWDPRKFGAGIVNAARLLGEPLSEPPDSRTRASEPAFPLFDSLFDEEVPPTTPAERLTTLFPNTSQETLKALDAELASLYALDSTVQTAVDQLTTVATPSPQAYANLRQALLAKDISTAMAAAVRRGQ